MNLNLTFLSIGTLITAALIQYAQIPANYLLIAGGIILVISLIAASLAKKPASKSNQQQQTRQQSEHYSTNPVIKDNVNGTVKWFNKTKGFGFITQENGEDVFVHQTSIAFKPNVLREGQAVTLRIVMDKKGPQAENVRKRA
ncbi:MAG TPA: cold shock domain-containing protein [Oceanospirillales bacterium]|nr:cold shock domain-containing protein [Oceanospirillales bacterium]